MWQPRSERRRVRFDNGTRGQLSDAELLSFVHWTGGDMTPDLAHLWRLYVWMEEPDYFRKDPLQIHREIEVTAERIVGVVDPWLNRPSA